MNERKLSRLQKEYRAFFLRKLEQYNVKSPAQLTVERKSEFFSEIKQDWATYKLLNKADDNRNTKEEIVLNKDIGQTETDVLTQQILVSAENEKGSSLHRLPNAPHNNSKYNGTHRGTLRQDNKSSIGTSKQIIDSIPNNKQTDELKILFTPNEYFIQHGLYKYPVVKMPKSDSLLKLPRQYRSNQKGYKEEEFYQLLKKTIINIEMTNDVHMVIPNFNKPYEPDIVLFDSSINLYIDIEIDEPYDGYYRYPTHYINPDDEIRNDDVRDLFFTESGWIVIRFTEKQVHCQPLECISYIREILNSIYGKSFTKETECENESQWDYNQCIQWQKVNYREKYLGIDSFRKQYSKKEIQINTEEKESIEYAIQRTKRFSFDNWDSNIAFDEESHRYIHPNDETGNAEYISTTTLIERFFPFDLKRYIEKKAEMESRPEEEVLDEFLLIRDEAAAKGTFLHTQIENYLKNEEYDSTSPEFALFLEFYDKEIKTRNLRFYDSEKVLVSNVYNVAGTVDCLFKKNEKAEYVMFDWKRSKKLIIDGYPRMYGYGFALSEINHLDNSSYYRYCLQQNIYKHILETEYLLKISSMKLVVLHENYNHYYVIDVPTMSKETNILLESLKVKI